MQLAVTLRKRARLYGDKIQLATGGGIGILSTFEYVRPALPRHRKAATVAEAEGALRGDTNMDTQEEDNGRAVTDSTSPALPCAPQPQNDSTVSAEFIELHQPDVLIDMEVDDENLPMEDSPTVIPEPAQTNGMDGIASFDEITLGERYMHRSTSETGSTSAAGIDLDVSMTDSAIGMGYDELPEAQPLPCPSAERPLQSTDRASEQAVQPPVVRNEPATAGSTNSQDMQSTKTSTCGESESTLATGDIVEPSDTCQPLSRFPPCSKKSRHPIAAWLQQSMLDVSTLESMTGQGPDMNELVQRLDQRIRHIAEYALTEYREWNVSNVDLSTRDVIVPAATILGSQLKALQEAIRKNAAHIEDVNATYKCISGIKDRCRDLCRDRLPHVGSMNQSQLMHPTQLFYFLWELRKKTALSLIPQWLEDSKCLLEAPVKKTPEQFAEDDTQATLTLCDDRLQHIMDYAHVYSDGMWRTAQVDEKLANETYQFADLAEKKLQGLARSDHEKSSPTLKKLKKTLAHVKTMTAPSREVADAKCS